MSIFLFVSLSVGYYKKSVTGETIDKRESWKFGNWDNQPSTPEVTKPIMPERIQKEDKKEDKKETQIEAKTYVEALNLSKEKKLPILIFFFKGDCHWCDKMKDVLNEQEVQIAMRRFIYLKVDAESNRDLARKFGIRPVPSFLKTDESEQTLDKKIGYSNEDNFVKWLKN